MQTVRRVLPKNSSVELTSSSLHSHSIAACLAGHRGSQIFMEEETLTDENLQTLQVQAQRSGSRPVTFTATLRNYQYGDICFAAAPPVGQTTQESGTNGLPAVTNPGDLQPTVIS